MGWQDLILQTQCDIQHFLSPVMAYQMWHLCSLCCTIWAGPFQIWNIILRHGYWTQKYLAWCLPAPWTHVNHAREKVGWFCKSSGYCSNNVTIELLGELRRKNACGFPTAIKTHVKSTPQIKVFVHMAWCSKLAFTITMPSWLFVKTHNFGVMHIVHIPRLFFKRGP